MGMTLWLHTLVDHKFSADSADHSWMYRLSDELDEICLEGGVTKLSDFFDFSYAQAAGDEDFADEDQDEEEDDDDEEGDNLEAAQGPGINGRAWFQASDGVKVVRVLLASVYDGELVDLDGRQTDDLCEELEDCLTRLDKAASGEGLFHLAVLE